MPGLGSVVLGYLIGIVILSSVIGIIIYVNSPKYSNNVKKQAQKRINLEESNSKRQVQQNIKTSKKCRPIQVGYAVDRDKFEEILNSNSKITSALADAIDYAIQQNKKESKQQEPLPNEKEIENIKLWTIEYILKNPVKVDDSLLQYVPQISTKLIKTKKDLQANIHSQTLSAEGSKFSTLLYKRKREKIKE